ncbi:nephronectin a isoform X1 [Acanthochromis polyacanthus]|uniref:nephronectin a isoform X1 n=1 Tax=Acanthochromis polyacanthus TaxID=80966 RepID=UPI00223438E6|nr:nephronectin a isoform X1 [Acanthochromis polyacanthus]
MLILPADLSCRCTFKETLFFPLFFFFSFPRLFPLPAALGLRRGAAQRGRVTPEIMELWIKLMLFCSCCLGASAGFDGRWPRQMASSNGLCRYGARVDCCWGWTRRSWGHCQPLFALTHRVVGIRCQPQAVCQPGCKHGDCVGPNKCKCHPGYTGMTCNQDLNECGLMPRPCKHRCMNTYGSYKCYCLNGYMLMPDGTCGNARTCGMANCQYGCEVLKGEVRCQCPSPGLQLAPDGRTCMDVDECAAGTAVCPRFRKCINTFGSYICKCHEGFDLQYINGKYQCIDVDECSLGQSHCSSFATCYNTPGSYKCKCKDGYRGKGHDCKPIPKVNIYPPRPDKLPPNHHNHIPDIDHRRTTTIRPPVTPRRIFPVIPVAPTTTTTAKTTTTTKPPLPPRRVTPPPRKPAVPTRKPFIPTRKPLIPTRRPYVPPRPVAPTRPPQPQPPVTPVDNTIQREVTKQRGDVHIPRNPGHNTVLDIDFDIELGNTADEAKDDPASGYLSCSFDDGLCGWIRDKDGDLHWETTPDPSGGRYLTIPDAGNKRTGRGARLVLPLTPPWNDGNLCLSFRHKLAGHHVGMLQVFVKKGKQYSPAVWGRTGGNGWRHTQITLWGAGLESVILKGERGRGRSGEMAVDDITLRKGACTEEHNLRRL